MAVKTWVAAHTGLPSIYSDVPVRVETVGGRVLADGSGPVLVSDALAEPGVPTTYTIGGTLRTLTRAPGPSGTAIVTTKNGRGVPGMTYVDRGDEIGWQSDISRFSPSSARWSLTPPARTGRGTFILHNLSREDEVWGVLRARGVVIISTATPEDGYDLRPVTIDQVTRSLHGHVRRAQFDVQWTETRIHVSAAPVVTWGEYEGLGDGWQVYSMLDLCRLVAGMQS